MLYLDDKIYFRSKLDTGRGLCNVNLDEVVLTQDKSVIDKCEDKGIYARLLSTYLGLVENIGLYEVYSFFFDGKIECDEDMLEVLFNGLLNDSRFCFCLNIGVTFCWFVVEGNKVRKIGNLQFSYTVSTYSVGKFMKRLRFEIAKSGFNLNRVVYLIWDKQDFIAEFENYFTNYSMLSDFFGKINGLKNLRCAEVMKLLSTKYKDRYLPTAVDFIDCLNDSFEKLGLKEKDGVLLSSTTFYKDYSSCESTIINVKDCSYGIILDCEGATTGKAADGVSCVGGIIYCKYNKVLLNIEIFYCEAKLLQETLVRVVENYKILCGDFISTKRITVLTFGFADEPMVTATLMRNYSKKVADNLLKKLKFVDCSPYINDCLDKNNIECRRRLLDIANALNVKILLPLHNPTNDARTLFNVLAKVLIMSKGEIKF